jgi:hypothetical protein
MVTNLASIIGCAVLPPKAPGTGTGSSTPPSEQAQAPPDPPLRPKWTTPGGEPPGNPEEWEAEINGRYREAELAAKEARAKLGADGGGGGGDGGDGGGVGGGGGGRLDESSKGGDLGLLYDGKLCYQHTASGIPGQL